MSARSQRRVRVAVIGAGPQALTVISHLVHLDPSLRDHVVAVDPTGTWMHRWHADFVRLGIDALRSPAVHHPHPDPYALLSFARERGRRDEFHGRYQSPGTALFADFCATEIQRYGLDRVVLSGTAVALHDDGSIDVRLGGAAGSSHPDGSLPLEVIRADHVVLAHGASSPVLPNWAAGHTTRHEPDRGRSTALDHPRGPVRHAATADVRTVRRGDRVVVVGGGSTAGHLAVGAAERGGDVILIHRRPLIEREFDTDPGWLGPKELTAFRALRDDRERAAAVFAARGGGSMPRRLLDRVEAASGDGRIRRCRGEVRHVSTDGSFALVVAYVPDRTEIPADHVWCATGWRPTPRSDVLLGPLLRRSGRRPIQGLVPVDDDLSVPVNSPASAVPDGRGARRVHVLGRAAALRLGPTAGNLAGGRAAADIVVASVLGVDALVTLEAERGILPVR